MRKTAIGFMVAVTVLAGSVGAQRPRQAEIDLQAAIRAETVDGDLRSGIKLYETIVASFSKTDRAVAAQALARMAESYQKLGDKESRRIYERIVREFADQKEAVALARARLGHPDSMARVKGDRAVWTGVRVDGMGSVSPDGRFLTYTDNFSGGNIVVRDLVTGLDRPLTTNQLPAGETGWGDFSVMSRDGRQVAYGWGLANRGFELRIASLEGTGVPASKRILNFGPDHDVASCSPRDWSPDGQQLAVSCRRRDGTGQIALVGVQTRVLQMLKSVDWNGPNKIIFSPDGRFISYDLKATDNGAERHLWVMAVDASRETNVVVHPSRNVSIAWSPDGRHLLFASDRTGTSALWALPIADGKPQAAPRMVKPDIGTSASLGLTTSGSLFVFKTRGGHYVNVAPIDLNEGKLLATSGTFQRFVDGGGRPDWSPDGRYLAYMSGVCGPSRPCTMAIRSTDSGQTRELQPKLAYFNFPRWSSDSRSLVVTGTDFKGRRGTYRIDARSGDVSEVLVPRPGAIEELAPDGTKLYYRLGGSIHERDLTSGADRAVFREKAVGNNVSISVSPDGGSIAAVEYAGKTNTLLIIPVSGGEPRELLRVTAPENMDGYRLIWAPDGRAVLVMKRATVEDAGDLWLIPVDGGRPRTIDVRALPGFTFFRLSPDARQIAFVTAAGEPGYEVWALENFLPIEQ